MKKKIVLTVFLMFILMFTGCGRNATGEKPFADLTSEDIVKTTVHIVPSDEIFEVTDYAELTKALNDIVIYDEDDSYKKYNGQVVTYTITLKDNTEITVNTFGSFIVINGVGYKTEYEPCEKLSQIANELAN